MFYIIAGVCRNNSDPIAGEYSTILGRLKESGLRPPLPPITCEQIAHGELASLLEEDDYNLATLVHLKLNIIQPDNYLFCTATCYKNVLNKLQYLSLFLVQCLSLPGFHMLVIMHCFSYPMPHVLYTFCQVTFSNMFLIYQFKLKSIFI